MGNRLTRRTILKAIPGGVATSVMAAPYISSSGLSANSDPVLIGVPTAQTAQAGVADHADYLNGTTLALEEINAAGGVLGRKLELVVVDIDPLSPESGQIAIDKLIDAKVHAISCAFSLAPIPAADASAKYKAPFLWGVTQRNLTDAVGGKSRQVQPSASRPIRPKCTTATPSRSSSRTMKDQGGWKPLNNGVHIVQEQIAYNQTISKALQEALPKSEFELAEVTDIQYPVQDWGPVIQEIKKVDAGAVMIDHWVAAEYAAFCKQFVADPVKGALVYLQYGPSQPEFLELAGRRRRRLRVVHGARRLCRREGQGVPREVREAVPRHHGPCLHRQWLRHRALPEGRLGSGRRSEPTSSRRLRLDPHQSLSRRLRLHET